MGKATWRKAPTFALTARMAAIARGRPDLHGALRCPAIGGGGEIKGEYPAHSGHKKAIVLLIQYLRVAMFSYSFKYSTHASYKSN